MSKYVFCDCETRSMTDLKKCGAWRYSEDASADCICIAYALDAAPVRVGTPKDALAFFRKEPPKDWFFVARNAPFEYAIFRNVLIPKYGYHKDYADPSRWVCTAALSRMHGLPASLEDSANYLNKKFKKLPDGKRLIGLYCIPAKDRKTGERFFREIPADDWCKMLEYNIIDVESDREAFRVLERLPNFEIEKETYQHDFALNVEGIRIDTAALDKLLSVFETATARAEKNMKIHGVNVRSPKQLKAWLLNRGIDVDDTKVETIEEIWRETLDEDIRDVMALRLFLGKASVKKYAALKNLISADGRLRYFIQYFGAHTGRYAGKGFQIHNLPKAKWPDGVDPVKEIERMIKEIHAGMEYRDLIEWGKKILPGLMLPNEGNAFISGDFSAVEARGIAYLAGCKNLLKEFMEDDKRGDKTNDLYSRTARRIAGANGKRQFGKVMNLAPLYGMGAEKAQATAEKWGVPVSFELAEKGIIYFRETYPEIPAFWYALEDAFRATWLSKKSHTVGMITFERGGNYIRVKLPNGRRLFYHQVKIDDGQLSFMNFGKKGARMKLWGGVLAENVTQAFCRDVLTDRMAALEKEGLHVRLHVHDEIVCDVPKKDAARKQKVFDRILNTAPEWCQGFPLKTDSAITTWYHK